MAQTPMAAAAAALSFNYVTVTGLIFVNKLLFSVVHFPPTTLTALHLAFTGAAIQLGMQLGVIARPACALDWRNTLLLAGLQGCAIVAGNSSLTFNSMSFYQLMKQLQLPVVLTLEYALYRKCVSPARLLWLAGAVAGVVTATVQDVQANAVGAVCAILGVVCTATEVVLWSRLQQAQKWGSLQLLGSVSPYGALITGVGAIAAERDRFATAAPALLQQYGVAILCGSCATALLVNWSTVMVSGKASAVTYALLGLFKTASVLIGGAVFFDGMPRLAAVVGASISVVCILGYTLQNIREREREKAAGAPPPTPAGQRAPDAALPLRARAPALLDAQDQSSSPGVSDEGEDGSPNRSSAGGTPPSPRSPPVAAPDEMPVHVVAVVVAEQLRSGSRRR